MRFNRLSAVGIIAATLSINGFSQTPKPDSLIQQLGTEYLKTPQAVGLSIGVYHAGKTYTYGFGTVEKGKDQRPTPTTVFEIGSITKTFTSTILAHAVLEGKVKLEDDIRQHLPEPYPNLEHNGQPIRLLHLANLTSELPNWLPDKPEVFQKANPDSIPYVLLNLHKNYTRQDFYRDLHQVKLAATPGTNPRHSNVAAQLLAFILERVYQTPLDNLIKKYITEPLGMKQTTFSGSATGKTAKGYDGKGNPMPYITMEDVQSSGGLASTTADMLAYIRFQLDEANKAVGLTHQKTVESPQDTVGLNWHIDRTSTGEREIWHTGGTFGFSSYVVLYPERKLCIVVLANQSDGSTQTKLAQIANKIVAGLRPK